MRECNLSFQQKSLFQQGYQRFTPAELKQLEWGLRFTPAVCSLLTALGLYFQLPGLLFTVAALGVWAFFFPGAHPMDLLYNHGVRRWFGAVPLPPNPFQRRLACLAAGLMNTLAGVLFLTGLAGAAVVVGVMLLALQAIVIFTHFCTLSWFYELLMRALGRWHGPVDEATASRLLADGATLVDVRGQNEFAHQSIAGAVNWPLEELAAQPQRHRETIGAQTCLLFCNSGTRSHIAVQKLRAAGIEQVYNLGPLSRAQAIVQGAGATA